jgi:hypothetical protein
MRAFGPAAERPEEARIVRAAVVERLVSSGVDRVRAEYLAEKSYRRVDSLLQRGAPTRRV